jgi:hypothetical protein
MIETNLNDALFNENKIYTNGCKYHKNYSQILY